MSKTQMTVSMIQANTPSPTRSGNGVLSSMTQPARSMDEGDAAPPDPEVTAKPKRRKYTAKYKALILAKVDACTKPGEIGAILRREGLYSSLLTNWRKQREAGLTPKKRGRKAKADDPRDRKIKALERDKRTLQREKTGLEAKLKRADLMLGLQKKISEILEIPMAELPNDESSS